MMVQPIASGAPWLRPKELKIKNTETIIRQADGNTINRQKDRQKTIAP